jgi:hypothetical protein
VHVIPSGLAVAADRAERLDLAVLEGVRRDGHLLAEAAEHRGGTLLHPDTVPPILLAARWLSDDPVVVGDLAPDGDSAGAVGGHCAADVSRREQNGPPALTSGATDVAGAGGGTVTVTGVGAVTVTAGGVDIEITGVSAGTCAVVAPVDGRTRRECHRGERDETDLRSPSRSTAESFVRRGPGWAGCRASTRPCPFPVDESGRVSVDGRVRGSPWRKLGAARKLARRSPVRVTLEVVLDRRPPALGVSGFCLVQGPTHAPETPSRIR